MPLAYQTPHKPLTGESDASAMAETPRSPPGAASDLQRGVSAGVDAQGERARKLFAKLDVERREQFTLKHLTLGHEEAVFAGMETLLDDGQVHVGGLSRWRGRWRPSQAVSTHAAPRHYLRPPLPQRCTPRSDCTITTVPTRPTTPNLSSSRCLPNAFNIPPPSPPCHPATHTHTPLGGGRPRCGGATPRLPAGNLGARDGR